MSALKSAVIFIPAFRKHTRFQGDLLRKLEGKSLVQRAIDKAHLPHCSNKSIHLLTDSENIALIGKRNRIGVFCSAETSLENIGRDDKSREYVDTAEQGKNLSVLLSPYAPLLNIDSLERAANKFFQLEVRVLQPVRVAKRRVFYNSSTTCSSNLFGKKDEIYRIESQAFMLMQPGQLSHLGDQLVSIQPWDAGDDTFEIETFQDWWVSEKLLRRKRIVFRVIGNNQVGMGHVYRALALAHELQDHEVRFVTDTHSQVAVESIIKRDHWLGIYPPERVIDEIIRLQPDMVINDVLNTKKNEVERLKKSGSLTISFEDLGSGARHTDLTVNEIYDVPQFRAKNVVWGREYFFLRDEFQLAHTHCFVKKARGIMLAFGGTDQHDLARKIFLAIRSLCDESNIFVHIVTGPGYRGYDRLMNEIEGNTQVSLTHGSEVISSIMEKVQLAITSNGRTVYEFAHMNIPAIVIAQHEREVTHAFASEQNGFIPLGLYQPGKTETEVVKGLKRLINDTPYREQLVNNMSLHQFTKNKEIVVDMIQTILDRSSKSLSV